jgi:signal transduction histidine kinase/ActR/RegA family two-component response regulator
MSDSGPVPSSPPPGAATTDASASFEEPQSDPPDAITQEPQARIRAAETRLLYANANTGVAITLVIATLLAYAQWNVVAQPVIAVWFVYMVAVSVARFVLAQRYWRASPTTADRRWAASFVMGTALATTGWGIAATVLYPLNAPVNEIFVVFVIGGVMLGSASLLAARPEAFVTFLLPTGLATSWSLATQGDEQHLLMGFLAIVFTIATIITTWRFHLAIESSFRLQFANENLIESLRKAKDDTDALNRELEFRVRERTAQLLEADQRKDEFLATLAHELRNPLAPIRFALESLKRDAPRATAVRAQAIIDRQVGQLVRLVDDLLDVSRITANKIHLRRAPLDLGRLMVTAVESITPLAVASGHALDVQVPTSAICIDGDATRLVQVFANVLSNAVKFTPRGGHIWFTAEQASDVAVVRIRDTGVGIANDVLPRVFDMFHQAEPVLERSTGGLGIGLTLARRLVQMHHGHIEVRSPGIDEGTEVEIRFPISTAVAPVAVADAPPVTATRHLRVLIVEDNIDAAVMMDMAVGRLGHLTRVAHDGASAVTAAIEFAPDVIFLDIGLPVINGYAVARALRSRPAFNDVYIAAVTGWGQDEDRRKAREAGCDSHFTKPLSPATLEELLARLSNHQPKAVRADTVLAGLRAEETGRAG